MEEKKRMMQLNSRQNTNRNTQTTAVTLIVNYHQEVASANVQALQRPLIVVLPIRLTQKPFVLEHTHFTLVVP
jgi:ribosomal protein S20